MRIDEAIKVLENETRIAEVNNRPWEIKAFKLGIEALKRIKKRRDYGLLGEWTELLGETEEK